MSSRADSPNADDQSPARGESARMSSSEREQLARDLLALVSATGESPPGAGALAAEVDALVGAISPEDARRVCDEIETGLRARQLYERFRSFYEASRRVSGKLRELDKDLVELARYSELFCPDACEDIALFHAALERARAGLSEAGVAASPGAEAGAELAFINYLARTHPGSVHTATATPRSFF